MSKRLQVILDDSELLEIQRAARRNKTTVAHWVRTALRAARRQEPRGDAKKKLSVVRAAAGHAFPTADVDAERNRTRLSGELVSREDEP